MNLVERARSAKNFSALVSCHRGLYASLIHVAGTLSELWKTAPKRGFGMSGDYPGGAETAPTPCWGYCGPMGAAYR